MIRKDFRERTGSKGLEIRMTRTGESKFGISKSSEDWVKRLKTENQFVPVFQVPMLESN